MSRVIHLSSVIGALKLGVALLPPSWAQAIKRMRFARMIRNRSFMSAEEHDAEFRRLHEWVSAGDWVIDVGANFGNYSARLSELVGSSGRVFSIEPVLSTFELLSSNMACLPQKNVTLFNVAVSDGAGLTGIEVPKQENGLDNPYMARLTDGPDASCTVMRMPLDALPLPQRVSLIKIDVEGHELEAVQGMQRLLARDRPLLVVEGRSPEVASVLAKFGYTFEDTPRSPNRVYRTA